MTGTPQTAPSPISICIRLAEPADAPAVAELYLASRRQFLPYAPIPHSDDDVRRWVAGTLFARCEVYVAVENDAIVGMMALARHEHAGWIDQLYLHPQAVGRSIGSLLVTLAKARLGAPIRLYTFQANAGARRFYERHGFEAIEFGDGAQNEERVPDVLYEWRRA
jgi:ribosomal protein S18 acetylase RimI-like enzyme